VSVKAEVWESTLYHLISDPGKDFVVH